jgi:hypothetical protein
MESESKGQSLKNNLITLRAIRGDEVAERMLGLLSRWKKVVDSGVTSTAWSTSAITGYAGAGDIRGLWYQFSTVNGVGRPPASCSGCNWNIRQSGYSLSSAPHPVVNPGNEYKGWSVIGGSARLLVYDNLNSFYAIQL